MRLYLDGDEKATLSRTQAITSRTINMALGNRADDNGTSYDLHGLIDEARISDTTRSADWIKAQYLSMTDAFITYGSEEEVNHPPNAPSDLGPASYVDGSWDNNNTPYAHLHPKRPGCWRYRQIYHPDRRFR